MIDLRLGDYRNVCRDVVCDALIADPPYGERTHSGHNDAFVREKSQKKTRLSRRGKLDGGPRAAIEYCSWSPLDVRTFVDFWSQRTRGWIVALTSDDLIPVWRSAYRLAGRVDFAPVPCVMRGMSVRVAGDGPSSWSVYAMVSRPRNREMATWGTLPGAYIVDRTSEWQSAGGGGRGKPMDLMRALVSDYSRPGQLVWDPCFGYGSTIAAALQKGRNAGGSEIDAAVYAEGSRRLATVQYVDLFDPGRAKQQTLVDL